MNEILLILLNDLISSLLTDLTLQIRMGTGTYVGHIREVCFAQILLNTTPPVWTCAFTMTLHSRTPT